MNIRSLDIRPGERWSSGRVALHMAAATVFMPPKPRRRFSLLRAAVWCALLPSVFALALVAALGILRRGL